MIVLKIIGWIILVIIGLQLLGLVIATLLMAVKVTLGLDFGESGTRVRLKWGFFKINLYPEQFTPEKIESYKAKFEKLKAKFEPFLEKRRAKQEEKKAAQAEEEQPEEEKGFDAVWEKIKTFDFEGAYAKLKSIFARLGGFNGVIEILKYVASKTKVMVRKILKHIVIKELFVDLTVSGNDAADTAMNYGKTCAAVFPAMGAICTNMKVREYDLEVNPDFLAKSNTGDLHTVLAFRPIFLVMALIGYGLKIMRKIIFKVLFSKSEGNENIKKNNKEKEKIKIGGA